MSDVLFVVHIPNDSLEVVSKDAIIPEEDDVENTNVSDNEINGDNEQKETLESKQKDTLETNQVVTTITPATPESFHTEPPILPETFESTEATVPIVDNKDDVVIETEPAENPTNEEIKEVTISDQSIVDDKLKKKREKLISADSIQYDHSQIVREILEKHKIAQATWQLTDNEESWQIVFPHTSSLTDDLLNSFLTAGIGNNSYTSISVVPITVNFPSMLHQKADEGQEELSNEFIQSVKSRLTVAQVINNVRSGSQLTFDYIMLVLMASVIAGVGLVENSSVLLVASMLVSPLMGPILGGTFGIVLHYRPLWKTGILNELIGLLLCLLSGFILGLLLVLTIPGWVKVPQEMLSRGEARSLFIGVIVAIPSGAGVALSILGGNAGSLVGVAISASLLPPAVNAGMCWAFSLYLSIAQKVEVPTNSTNATIATVADVSKIYLKDYQPSELAEVGGISLCLTLINIFVIFVMGVLILKVKEVAPHTGTAVTKSFWKKDLETTRKYLNRSSKSKKNDHENMDDMILEEFYTLSSKETIKSKSGVKLRRRLKDVIETIELDETYNTVAKSMPGKSAGTSWRALKTKLTPVQEESSRFAVTKAYNISNPVYISNSRFVVSNLDEEDKVSITGSVKSTLPPQLPNDSTKVIGRKKSNAPSVTMSLLAAQDKDDSLV